MPPPPEPPADETTTLASALRGHVERARRSGVRRLARPTRAEERAEERRAEREVREERPLPAPAAREEPSPEPRPAAAHARRELVPAAPPPSTPAEETPAVAANRAGAAACATLGELRERVAACTACALAGTRTQTVFHDGSEHARVMFVGEAPGEQEDRRGVPFVGPAGQLLTDIIEKGMGLSRAETYIANVLKCRPPGNRDPEPEEKALCTPFLDRQIELVDPEVIITLGLHATRHLLGSTLSMGRLRGRIHAWNGRKVVATYHPAFLLRNPAAKKDCWQDIQMAMRELGLEPPARGSSEPAR